WGVARRWRRGLARLFRRLGGGFSRRLLRRRGRLIAGRAPLVIGIPAILRRLAIIARAGLVAGRRGFLHLALAQGILHPRDFAVDVRHVGVDQGLVRGADGVRMVTDVVAEANLLATVGIFGMGVGLRGLKD